MANADRSKGNLAVNMGEELLERINKVAKALHKSQAEFVREKLDELTRAHLEDVEVITKHEDRIAQREKQSAGKR